MRYHSKVLNHSAAYNLARHCRLSIKNDNKLMRNMKLCDNILKKLI